MSERIATTSELERRAVEAVAEWLASRDGRAHIFQGRRDGALRADYRRRAASLLAPPSQS